MRSGLRIGIDFDNTIINYDDVFCAAAKRGGLIGSTLLTLFAVPVLYTLLKRRGGAAPAAV